MASIVTAQINTAYISEKLSEERRDQRDLSIDLYKPTGYGLNDQGVRVPVRQDFYPLHIVQTHSVTHLAFYPMSTGGSFQE
jgi:hypothetical protein